MFKCKSRSRNNYFQQEEENEKLALSMNLSLKNLYQEGSRLSRILMEYINL